jgi:hypothetical protein
MSEEANHRYNWDFGVAPYDTPEGRANAPQWLRDEKAAGPQPVTPRPPAKVYPTEPVLGAVAKNAALYCFLGILIPGLPSMLIRKDKVVPSIQLGLWVLAWILTIVLIGFFLYIGVAVWAAITGYQDAQEWNREHGFIS